MLHSPPLRIELMSLYYAHSGPRSKDSGKFRPRVKLGTDQQAGEESHRGWFYSFISHQAGISIKRTSFNVSISDPQGNRVEYLRGFSSMERAGAAACEWIDEVVKKIELAAIARGLGRIPTLPNEPTQENPVSQEK